MGTFSVTHTSRDSRRDGRFVGHETVCTEKTPEQAREAVPAPVLTWWDQQMGAQGNAVVHVVVDGHPTLPVEYGIRFSYME